MFPKSLSQISKPLVLTAACLRKIEGNAQAAETMGHGHSHNGNMIVDGDMVIEKSDALLQSQPGQSPNVPFKPRLWKGNTDIPYCFSEHITPEAKQAFLGAVQQYKNLIPCVGYRFKEVALKKEYHMVCSAIPGIFVYSGYDGCFASLGHNGWQSATVLHLGRGCELVGTAAHELGHILGMFHEHSRPDHGKTIRILWDNIAMKEEYQLESVADTRVPYDLMSLMHYGQGAFAKWVNGWPMKTMEIINDPSSPHGPANWPCHF